MGDDASDCGTSLGYNAGTHRPNKGRSGFRNLKVPAVTAASCQGQVNCSPQQNHDIVSSAKR
jgi:hypothetical protein